MKRITFFITALCVIALLFAASSGNVSSEEIMTTASEKKAAASEPAEYSFILGDIDGNGVITIDDATLIQYVLCGLVSDKDGKIALRGDVDGNQLQISDATYIMMYLACFEVDYSIGGPVNSDIPEPTAAQSTVAASDAPDAPEETVQAPQEETSTTQEQTASNPEPTAPGETENQQNTVQETTIGVTLDENDLPFDIL